MKIKLVYIYLFIVIVTVIGLIISSNGKDEINSTEAITTTNMPDDDVHKSVRLGEGTAPSGSNVSSEFLNRMNNLKSTVENNPNDTLKLREYADLLSAAHKQDEAIKYYSKIVEADPTRKDILTSLAIINYNKNNFTEAKTYINSIIEKYPNDEEAHYNLGLIEARIGDIAAARKEWQDIITNHPNSKMSDLAKNALENLGGN